MTIGRGRTRTDGERSDAPATRPFFSTSSSPTHGFFSHSPVQAKLTVGAPGDLFEEEADAMADRVVQGTPAGPVDETPDEEVVQAKGDRAITVSDPVERTLQGAAGGGQALPPALRDDMEAAFQTDLSDVRVHTGTDAAHLNRGLSARAFTHGSDVYFNAGEYQPHTSEGQHLLAHELTHVVQQTGGTQAGSIIQRKDKQTYVPHRVHVPRAMTTEEFRALAMHQIFGGVVTGLVWHNVKASYDPADNPHTVQVDLQLLQQHRGEASAARGIPGGVGGVTGAPERAKTFHAGPASDQKTALLNEIDRRYFEAVGDTAETKIKPGEAGNAALWRMIRDEVLFQHEYIANLPPQVKELITFSTQGKDLTPADYDRLFAIAKKIEKMPAGQAADYASRVRGTTTDLKTFEASLDKYRAELAARQTQNEERDKIHTKLLGLDEVYKKYRLYKSLLSSGGGLAISGRYGGGGVGAGLVTTKEALKVRAELETELQAHGFAGITDFEAYIKTFETAFEAEAAHIAKDLLEKFAGKLYKDSQRLNDPAVVRALHQKLGGVRSSQAEFASHAHVWNEYAKADQKAKEQARIPGQAHIKTSDYTAITQAEAEEAKKKADAAKASAQTQYEGVATDVPVLQEAGLPDDKKLDKVALVAASESQLGAMLQAQIQRRMRDIEEAKKAIADTPELIYKMDKLLPQFYVQQGITTGSIHDMIIQDKMRSDAILKIAKGIALAIVAIALSVISFGAATPVVIAAGAGLLGAGLGVYMALDEYAEYTAAKNLADVGFAGNPSMVWVVLAVLGAGLDVAGAVKAVRALGPAAKTFNATGDLTEFTKAVRALEKANEIDARIARAAEKAGEAQKSLSAASTELSRVLASKAYSFPGPLLDPDVYKAVVNLARQAIKTGVATAEKFVEQIRLARINAQLGDLTPEELAKAKQAWHEAKALEAAESAIEAAEKAKAGTYTTTVKWAIHPAIPARPHSTIKGGYWAKRTPQTNPRVDAFERKINPSNESFFLTHPDGKLVQFENLAGTSAVQDGKLVMKARSQYHVADLPPFAAESVLKEARRQVEAASHAGLKVEWLVSDAKAIQQLEALFKKENVAITIRAFAE